MPSRYSKPKGFGASTKDSDLVFSVSRLIPCFLSYFGIKYDASASKPTSFDVNAAVSWTVCLVISLLTMAAIFIDFSISSLQFCVMTVLTHPLIIVWSLLFVRSFGDITIVNIQLNCPLETNVINWL